MEKLFNSKNIIKNKQTSNFIDVFSTNDNEEKENLLVKRHQHQTSQVFKSPNKKNCLVTTFSKMSPFKTLPSENLLNLSENLTKNSFEIANTFSPVKVLNKKLPMFKNKIYTLSNLNLEEKTKLKIENSLPCQDEKLSSNINSEMYIKKETFLKSENLNNTILQSFTKLNNQIESNNKNWFFPPSQTLPLTQSNSLNWNRENLNYSFSLPSTSTTTSSNKKIFENTLQSENKNFDDDAESESEDNKTNESEKSGIKISRKDKSLGKLCRRFLLAMGEEAKNSTSDVHLESVAKKMKVEKRRIYDIVNVMEALEAMSKTNKSFYRWHGLLSLPTLMHSLQREAIETKFPERIMQVEKAMCNFTELSSVNTNSRRSISTSKFSNEIVGSLIEEKKLAKSSSDSHLNNSSFDCSLDNLSSNTLSNQSLETTLPLSNYDSDTNLNSGSGKNSLAQLCKRFLMVLLCNPKGKRKVSLDVASTVLIKDPESEGFEPPSRSRCRRLYDIANVLVAMELIKKVHYLFGTKKIPLFVYCGPEPDACRNTAEKSMHEFLDKIGLSAISNVNQENKHNACILNNSQKKENFKIPSQQISNKITKKNFNIQAKCLKDEVVKKTLNEDAALDEANLQYQTNLSELSFASRSLLPSTLSQNSGTSPIIYLTEMAEIMRKRFYSSIPISNVFDKKNNYSSLSLNNENDEKKTITQETTQNRLYKRQKISNFSPQKATYFNTDKTTENSKNLENIDLPKPKPVNPLINQQQTNVIISTMNDMYKNISPCFLNSSSVITSTKNNSTNNLSQYNCFKLDFDVNKENSGVENNVAQQKTIIKDNIQLKNSFLTQSLSKNKPKVAHSILSILGNSQTENIVKKTQPNVSFLTSSPKAFKPINNN